MKKRPQKQKIHAFLFERLLALIGVVLIWRGVWHILDLMDIYLLGGTRLWTSIVGVLVGFLMLYLPDKSLKELL